jgi:hypothetical protein
LPRMSETLKQRPPRQASRESPRLLPPPRLCPDPEEPSRHRARQRWDRPRTDGTSNKLGAGRLSRENGPMREWRWLGWRCHRPSGRSVSAVHSRIELCALLHWHATSHRSAGVLLLPQGDTGGASHPISFLPICVVAHARSPFFAPGSIEARANRVFGEVGAVWLLLF